MTRSSFAQSLVNSEAIHRDRPLTVAQIVDTAAVSRSANATLSGSMWVHRGADIECTSKEGPEEVCSGLTTMQKMRPALAGFAASTVLGAFSVQQSLYLSTFGGEPTLIGVLNIALVVYDVWNGPVFGRLSDEGFFNFAFFRDIQAWGRRAPLTILTIPVGMLAGFSFFVGPESLDPVGVALWFGFNRFITATAFSMFFSASGAAVSEIFPTQEERVVVLMYRGVANAVGTLVGAGAIGPIALSQGEAGSDTQRILFLVLGALTAALWMLIFPWGLLQRKTLLKQTTEKPPSLLRACRDTFTTVPCFLIYCISEHLVAAPMAMIVMLIPFFMQQCLGFSRENVSLGMALVVGTFGISAVFGTPLAAVLARRFDPSRLIGSMVSILGFSIGSGFVLGYFMREESTVVSIGAICLLTGLPGGICAATYLLCRTVIIAWIVDFDQVTRAKACGALPAESLDDAAAAKGVSVAKTDEADRSPSSATKSTQLPILPARRDGLYQAIAAAFQICGAAWTGLTAIGFGLLGYEASRDDADPPQEQPESCRVATFILCCVVCPGTFIAYGLCMLSFPLRGERLRRLTEDYLTLFKKISACEVDLPAGDHSSCASSKINECRDVADQVKDDHAIAALSVVQELPGEESPRKVRSETGETATVMEAESSESTKHGSVDVEIEEGSVVVTILV
eukprot:CAMPEP_0178412180 /NCGR_PEP_ID=MMETSP0689_2-20121128/21879_1 /TAXON_ID=160604 /ORGANISM="Amphidinium massartii, Strain CS-259" /LENGTH=681 /DNA_ID=CAMNT_0020033413 /DNA_START=186 /DNA_END=2231 /DNA_ORIENTATION=+